jgi:thioredoxin reductase (NADPH)
MEFVFEPEPKFEAPEPGRVYDLIVVGGGPAGLTAALYGARAGLSTAVLEKNKAGGLMATTEKVENCPGCVEGSGADIAQHLLQQAAKFGAHYGNADVIRLDLGPYSKQVVTSSANYLSRAVIVTTGSQPIRLNVPGEQEYWGRGVSFCATCDAPFFAGKPIAVVGGGNSALQESEFLLRYVSDLTIIEALDHLTASQVLRERILSHNNVKVYVNTLVREIRGNGGVNAVQIENRQSQKKKELPVAGVFIFVGLRPNSDLVRDQLDLDEQGYVVTTPRMETNVAGVYAAGDLRRGATRQIVTASADGAIAALTALEWLQEQTREASAEAGMRRTR